MWCTFVGPALSKPSVFFILFVQNRRSCTVFFLHLFFLHKSAKKILLCFQIATELVWNLSSQNKAPIQRQERELAAMPPTSLHALVCENCGKRGRLKLACFAFKANCPEAQLVQYAREMARNGDDEEEGKFDVDAECKSGCTALLVAVTKSWAAATSAILELNAAVDKATNNGATPLYIACRNGHVDVARLLLEKGANVDKVASDGATPLHIACH